MAGDLLTFLNVLANRAAVSSSLVSIFPFWRSDASLDASMLPEPTMEVEAIDEGPLGKILVPAGTQAIKVNEPIALLLAEGEPLVTEPGNGLDLLAELVHTRLRAAGVVEDDGAIVGGRGAAARRREATHESVTFPAQALAGDAGDLLLVLPLRVREEEPAARGEERDHAAVGGARRIGVRALVLREATHVAAGRGHAEDVPSGAVATHEDDPRIVRVG